MPRQFEFNQQKLANQNWSFPAVVQEVIKDRDCPLAVLSAFNTHTDKHTHLNTVTSLCRTRVPVKGFSYTEHCHIYFNKTL